MSLKIKTTHRLGILGKTGSGKSYLAKKIITSLAQKSVVLIYDLKHEYAHVARDIPDIDYFNFDVPRGAYRFKSNATIEHFNHFCDVCWRELTRSKKRKAIILIDEMHILVPNTSLIKFPGLMKLITMGRAYGIGMIMLTQRPALFNKTALSQCRTIISFQLDAQTDLKAIESYLPPDKVRSLKRYHFLIYDDETGVQEHKPI